MTATEPTEPKLAAPGAGLPAVELAIARMLFALRRRTGSRKSFEAIFHRERQLIRDLLRQCDAEQGSRRVLIRRLAGLEDSSRYWSVAMTLEHLRIVNREIARVIGALLNGNVPAGEASTAAVKPSPEVGLEVVSAYEDSCDKLRAVVADSGDLNTQARFAHPWFGPLNAAGWHALACVHLGIHRKQMERILVELRWDSLTLK